MEYKNAPETKTEKTRRRRSKKEEKEPKSVGREILSWVLTILAAVAIALVIRSFLFEPIKVDG